MSDSIHEQFNLWPNQCMANSMYDQFNLWPIQFMTNSMYDQFNLGPVHDHSIYDQFNVIYDQFNFRAIQLMPWLELQLFYSFKKINLLIKYLSKIWKVLPWHHLRIFLLCNNYKWKWTRPKLCCKYYLINLMKS